MTKKWTKPLAGATALGLAGAFTLSLDGVAQAVDPLHPKKDHDTFQLVVASTASDTVVVMQNTLTGELIEAPWPELVKYKKAKMPED
jgi:hypothetical protein